MRRVGPVLTAAAAAVALLALVSLPAAGAEPSSGTATVDGDVAEWAPADVFDEMVAVTPPHPPRATLSLRYDCAEGTLYAMVQALPGVVLQTLDPAEAYLRLGATGKLVSGTNGDGGFAWVGRSGDAAQGFEMSAPASAGDHLAALRVHAKVPDGSADGYETIDLDPRYQDLSLGCTAPAALRASAAPGDPADPGDPGAVAPTSLVRTGLAGGPALLAVASVLILAGLLSLRLRRRLAAD